MADGTLVYSVNAPNTKYFQMLFGTVNNKEICKSKYNKQVKFYNMIDGDIRRLVIAM